MTYSVEISLQGERDHGTLVVGNAGELDGAIDRILAAGQLYHPPTMFVRERPRFGPAGVPDHGLKLGVDRIAGYGALAYLGEFEEISGTWITASDTAPAEGPTLYLDFDNASESHRTRWCRWTCGVWRCTSFWSAAATGRSASTGRALTRGDLSQVLIVVGLGK